jgi:hypothetical protein
MDLAWSMQGFFWGHQKRSLQGPSHMDLIWRGPHSDLGNRGDCREVHAKTKHGPVLTIKNGHLCFPAGNGLNEPNEIIPSF